MLREEITVLQLQIFKSVSGGKETVPDNFVQLGSRLYTKIGLNTTTRICSVHVFEKRHFSAQPERDCHNPNPTSTELEFDMKMTHLNPPCNSNNSFQDHVLKLYTL